MCAEIVVCYEYVPVADVIELIQLFEHNGNRFVPLMSAVVLRYAAKFTLKRTSPGCLKRTEEGMTVWIYLKFWNHGTR